MPTSNRERINIYRKTPSGDFEFAGSAKDEKRASKWSQIEEIYVLKDGEYFCLVGLRWCTYCRKWKKEDEFKKGKNTFTNKCYGCRKNYSEVLDQKIDGEMLEWLPDWLFLFAKVPEHLHLYNPTWRETIQHIRSKKRCDICKSELGETVNMRLYRFEVSGIGNLAIICERCAGIYPIQDPLDDTLQR